MAARRVESESTADMIHTWRNISVSRVCEWDGSLVVVCIGEGNAKSVAVRMQTFSVAMVLHTLPHIVAASLRHAFPSNRDSIAVRDGRDRKRRQAYAYRCCVCVFLRSLCAPAQHQWTVSTPYLLIAINIVSFGKSLSTAKMGICHLLRRQIYIRKACIILIVQCAVCRWVDDERVATQPQIP